MLVTNQQSAATARATGIGSFRGYDSDPLRDDLQLEVSN